MKKGCLIAAAVVVGLVIAIIILVFALTRGAVDAGDRFLALLGEGKTQEAYVSADPAFRTSQTEEAFAAVVKQLGLSDYASASWRSREVENNVATLEGTVKTKSGGNVPLTMKLIKSEGVWRVLSLSGPPAGATAVPAKKQVPPDEELRKLATKTLLDFNAAIQAKDFTAFYNSVSALWKSQTDAKKLQAIFQAFIDKEASISGVKDVPPAFDEPPAINEDGVLVLSGYYPTKPMRVIFKLKYVYEHPDWKLIGINVQMKE